MANKILTWEDINTWGGVTYDSNLKKCPTKALVQAVGLIVASTVTSNLLVTDVSKITYSNITIKSIKAPDIPAKGGTVTSGTVTYSQTKTTKSYLNGTSTNIITSGGTVTWSGSVIGNHLYTTVTPRTAKGTLTAKVTLNGKSATANVTVYQLANEKTIYSTDYQIDWTPLGIMMIYDEEWVPIISILGHINEHKLEASITYVYTSESRSLEFQDVSDSQITWELTNITGNLPFALKLGNFQNGDTTLIGQAFVYCLPEGSAATFDYYGYIVGTLGVRVGEKLTGSYTIKAIYNGYVYSFTNNSCYIERLA